ncbi:3-oxoacyl-[acyl-carrier-protein] reductase FabG [Porphyromonas levii]|uniref:3-oxoacyl-[acyl-carrier-protein] reductase n=1 Tax=Porphyromonas levii TaxID=28114 RepID=UPI001BA5A434|nr:3-oxoacyl-[acyl-carrier-protein] reductase [Porphyromonas levii]MBR8764188.1 3-oxoacyl-[acyl-carrier-protein] reductase FabG [Porphyromonas levii]MBR8766056.1 3-oxoacyl-[acyl-carrier-protein] reductase FabG [Porphyromonas levii]
MEKILSGKVAIVTGGSRGIGRAIALELASQGADIAFTGRSINDNTRSLEEELAALDVKGKAYATDAANYSAAKAFVEEVVAEFGKVDILVNNAGITKDTLLVRMTEEQWDDVLTVNLKSAFNLTQAVAMPMMKARGGSIINISSVVGVQGNAGQANYSASKAGLLGFTKSVAKELGSRGIRANAVAPGFIKTDMTGVLDEKIVAEWSKSIALRRPGEAKEVAQVVVFLASDAASYITGQTINVCGGMVM